jgi:hypothetical protein
MRAKVCARAGDERAWWARHGVIDPLKIAEKLWAVSCHGRSGDADDPSSAAESDFATTPTIAAETRSP